MQLEHEDVPSGEDCDLKCQTKRMMEDGKRNWERDRILMSSGGRANPSYRLGSDRFDPDSPRSNLRRRRHFGTCWFRLVSFCSL